MDRDPGPIPNRWLNCPRKSSAIIVDKFIAFKTPLGSQFNNKVPEINRFTPSMLFDYMKAMKVKLGLWIDLTNTNRFYDKREIEKMNCKYYKMSCRGHGETPSKEQTTKFCTLVEDFIAQNPDSVVGVHCTHGFNRTGFLLVSYMVEKWDWSVDDALAVFAKYRQPGIYKQDYIDELYKRYSYDGDVPAAPPRPDWCNEEEDGYDDDDRGAPSFSEDNGSHSKGPPRKRQNRKETDFKKDHFLPRIDGVEPFNTQPRFREIQRKVQSFCKWESTGFPGCQPVSMDRNNIRKISEKPYMVSWKADGVRYMMLIDDKDEVYMFDRDNCAFKVHGLQFLHNKEDRHLRDTLLDGEMVVDHVEGETRHRFLCYDVVRFEGMNVGKAPFNPVRISCIQNEVINPRNRAITSGVLDKDKEPFRVCLKAFWDVSMAERLLGEEFARTLHHEPDGLIFQPAEDPYVPGPCPDVLKWKPSNMNSIDFKLRVEKKSGEGILTETVGCLYVGRCRDYFATIKLNKALRALDGKIVECMYDSQTGQWVFMRERTDKTFPNSYDTAISVWQSISAPVTKNDLLAYIVNKRYSLKPPPKRPRH